MIHHFINIKKKKKKIKLLWTYININRDHDCFAYIFKCIAHIYYIKKNISFSDKIISYIKCLI